MRVLVTGAAGHIGAQVTSMLVEQDIEVIGLDSFTDFYSPEMKQQRVEAFSLASVIKNGDMTDLNFLQSLFARFKPTHVVNLAARAGVRSTWEQFGLYNQSNIVGFQNLIEVSKKFEVEHLIFASSSSVYGEGIQPPFKESTPLPIPKSYYAMTKISNEITAQAASADIKSTGLRFFTVYGHWGRPDMATLQFVAAGVLGRTAILTGGMEIMRDFTHVRDAAQVVIEILQRNGNSFEIFNVAGGRPQSLSQMIRILLEEGLEIKTNGGELSVLDVPLTHGSTEKLSNFGITLPTITLKQGLQEVIDWARYLPPDLLAKWVKPPSSK